MSGTIYDELKKKGDSKKREQLKFIVAILSTNLLVALLCLNSGPSTQNGLITLRKGPTLHSDYKMIIVPLTVLVDLDPASLETPVTLMTKSKKILIKKAYLHQEIKDQNRGSDGLTRFKIEIPEVEVLKLSADAEVEMIAIPEVKLKPLHQKAFNKRVSHYEIDL